MVRRALLRRALHWQAMEGHALLGIGVLSSALRCAATRRYVISSLPTSQLGKYQRVHLYLGGTHLFLFALHLP